MKLKAKIYSGMFAAAMLFGPGRALAQPDFTLYQLPALQQSSFLNPAKMPQAKFNLYLPLIPSVGVGVSNSFAPELLFRKDKNGVNRIGLTRVIPELYQRNSVNANVQLDLLALGIKRGKNYFSLNISEKVDAHAVYTRDMADIFWNGNGANLMGRRADFDYTGAYLNHYRELGIGYAREVNKKLTLGVKAKYLYGMENIYTRKSDFGITTDNESFGLRADGSIDVRTSGISQEAIDAKSDDPRHYLFGLNNRGMAIDLGVQYKMLDNDLVLSASVVDLGFIRWNEGISNYRKENFDVAFNGANILDVVGPKDGTITPASESIADSVSNALKPEQYYDSYTAPLAGKAYLGANMQLTDRMNAGVLLYGQMNRGQLLPGVSFSMNHQINHWLQTSLSYNIYNRSYADLGAGLAFNMKALQIFAMSDNIVSALGVMNVKNVHARIGCNFIFGRLEKEKPCNLY